MKQIGIDRIAEAVCGRIINQHLVNENTGYNNVSIDSRTIGDKDIFIPIKGENFDGHDYISMAYEKGAIIAFTEDEHKISDNQIGIYVKDTGQALKDFAKYYLSLFHIPVIAITGSVGKTSCKEMIASVLSARYHVHKTSGNYNNEIGLPLTTFKLEEDHEVVVLEMGMNHYGELHRLSEIARPDVAVITNIGEAHIENFGSKDGILKAKSEILDFLKEDGLVVLNGDDPYLRKLQQKISFKTLTFGFKDNNDYYIEDYKVLGWKGLQATIKTACQTFFVKLDTLGKHMLYNILPGIIIGHYLKMTDADIEKGASQYKPAKMRMTKLMLGKGIVVINDAYNASVDSMKSALETLSSLDTEGRKVAVLGDMFEMGDHSEVAHRQVGEIASKNDIDLLVCIGTDAEYIASSAILNGFNKTKLLHFKKKEELTQQLSSVFQEKDTVIVKASRGMYLEKVIEALQEYYES